MAPPAWAPPERMFVIGRGQRRRRAAVERGRDNRAAAFADAPQRRAPRPARSQELHSRQAGSDWLCHRAREARRRCRAGRRRRGRQARAAISPADAGHGAANAAPLEIRLVAVAQLVRLVTPGRSAGRRARAAERAILEMDIGLDRRAAAGIENLARRHARYSGSRHEWDPRMLRTRKSGSAEGFSIIADATRLAAAVSRSSR